LWGVVLFAVASLVEYFLKFWRQIDDSVKQRRRRELLLMERAAQIEMHRERRAARLSRRQAFMSGWRARQQRRADPRSRTANL